MCGMKTTAVLFLMQYQVKLVDIWLVNLQMGFGLMYLSIC